MAKPIATTSDATILLGTNTLATDLFSWFDPDGDPITKIRVYDTFEGVSSGYFTFNNVIQPSHTWITVNIGQAAGLLYNSGVQIGKETLRFAVQAGGQWSNSVEAWLYTVVENKTPPVVNAPSDIVVVQNEHVLVSQHVSGSDPDGHPIVSYTLTDRNVNAFSGYFWLDGSAIAAGTPFTITPDEFSRLRFYAAFGAPNNDLIDIQVNDGVDDSLVRTINGATAKNLNRPVVQPTEFVSSTREKIRMRDLFSWTDADGSSVKKYRFFDTSPHFWTGHMLLNGVEQPSKSWVQITNTQLDDMEWLAADRTFNEQVRVQVFDGRFWSAIQTIRVRTDEKPVFGAPDVEIFNELEEKPIKDIFTKLDQGPAYTKYQIYDTDGEQKTGKFRLGLSDYSANTIHTLTPQQFSNVVFKGSVFDIRGLDQVYVRANNGSFWGDWTRLNANTETNMYELSFTSWQPFLPPSSPQVITYSFMQTWPTYGTAGEATENQFIAPWNALKDGMRQMFESVEEFVNIDFQEVPDNLIDPTTGFQGGIHRIGTYCAESNTIAYASFPGPNEVNGDIFFNRIHIGGPGDGTRGSNPNIVGPPAFGPCTIPFGPYTDHQTYTYDSFTFTVGLHELGHAIGLKHTSQVPAVSPQANSDEFSVMPPAASPGPNGLWARSFMLYDIAALQRTYGATVNNPGDTVYDLAYFGGSFGQQKLFWDTGGFDTIDVSHSIFDNTLTLREGDFNTIDGNIDNMAIAFNTYIEELIGGLGQDTLFGNERDNTLDGGLNHDRLEGYGGSDLLTGGRGNDTFVWKMSDGDDRIDEKKLAGRDTIEIGLMLGMNDFAEDFSFSKLGKDLLIDFTIDQGLSRGSITISNQQWGGSRVETLDINPLGESVDLVYLYNNISDIGQRFTISNVQGQYGSLVIPV